MVKNKNQKRILLIHRFFFPDSPPYAIILEDMRKMLISQGYLVDVLSSQPSYKQSDKDKKRDIKTEESDGSIIYRLPVFKFDNKMSKLLNFFWFPIVVFFFLLFSKKYDVITVSTAPQVLLAFFVSLVAKLKSSHLIYHCMDIHPEIGRISGEFSNRFIFNFLTWMDNITCNISANIIVLSSDMKSSLLKRNKGLKEKIVVVNNYDLTLNEKFEKDYFTNDTQIRRVVFTGNIGRYQNLEYFVQALLGRKSLENFELVFVGEGSALDELKSLAEPLEKNVKFIPHQTIAVARKIISEADMGIVSLQDKIIQYAYPSKTMTYLAEGTPILLNTDAQSEIAQFISSKKIGVQVDAKNLDEIYDIYKKLSQSELRHERKYVQKVFENNFSKKIYDQKISKLFKDILKQSYKE